MGSFSWRSQGPKFTFWSLLLSNSLSLKLYSSGSHGLWLLTLLYLLNSGKHLFTVIVWVLLSVQHCIEYVGEREGGKRMSQVKNLSDCPHSVAVGEVEATESK